jgi:hypothetical protein
MLEIERPGEAEKAATEKPTRPGRMLAIPRRITPSGSSKESHFEPVSRGAARLKVAETDDDAAKRQPRRFRNRHRRSSRVCTMTDYEVKAPLGNGGAPAWRAGGGSYPRDRGSSVSGRSAGLRAIFANRASARISFTTPADPDRKFEGKLSTGRLDERSRAATVLFEVENRDRALRIGMQANVSLETEERFEGLLVPEEALVEVEGRRFVYVLRSGEEFERREVKLADAMGATRVVLVEGFAGRSAPRDLAEPGKSISTSSTLELRPPTRTSRCSILSFVRLSNIASSSSPWPWRFSFTAVSSPRAGRSTSSPTLRCLR